jgi:ribosomal protein S12 methylthiotransferase
VVVGSHAVRQRTGSLDPVPSAPRFFLETLGCPKNAVDSDKIRGTLLADGLVPTDDPTVADVVVVNTCAFVEAARAESIETIVALADAARPGSRVVVTGCLAERSGAELAAALPEVEVVGFAGAGAIAAAQPVRLGRKPRGATPTGVRDLLELPRPAPTAPWAYVKIAEGCDRACAFCAIPQFRGRQRSRRPEAIDAEARQLVADGAAELVLVAQDLASYGRDAGEPGALVPLLRRLDGLAADGLRRIRLLYLYPSEVKGRLVEAMLELATCVPYFDLSLQHPSRPLTRRMARWGDGDRFRSIITGIRAVEPDAAFRSSFIVGFPGETEDDHDELLAFLADVELDWAGFFAFSEEAGTAAADLVRDDAAATVPAELVAERLRECGAVQEPITAARRDQLIGTTVEVLVDAPTADGPADAVGRTYREAPEIDGVVHLTGSGLRAGTSVPALVTGAWGPDLEAVVQ